MEQTYKYPAGELITCCDNELQELTAKGWRLLEVITLTDTANETLYPGDQYGNSDYSKSPACIPITAQKVTYLLIKEPNQINEELRNEVVSLRGELKTALGRSESFLKQIIVLEGNRDRAVNPLKEEIEKLKKARDEWKESYDTMRAHNGAQQEQITKLAKAKRVLESVVLELQTELENTVGRFGGL